MPRPPTTQELSFRGSTLGRTIAARRSAEGLTQSRLAETSGVDLQTLRKIEHGHVASPGVFTVAAIARTLGVTLDALVSSRAPCSRRPVVGSLGYEGRDLASFLDQVVGEGIDCVVDVRLTPLSRKVGFSKTRLRSALADVGVDYVHYRSLGNPKENRPLFLDDRLAEGKRHYRDLLCRAEAQRDLRALRERAEQSRVAVLCFEADEERCHRSVVLDEVHRLG